MCWLSNGLVFVCVCVCQCVSKKWKVTYLALNGPKDIRTEPRVYHKRFVVIIIYFSHCLPTVQVSVWKIEWFGWR